MSGLWTLGERSGWKCRLTRHCLQSDMRVEEEVESGDHLVEWWHPDLGNGKGGKKGKMRGERGVRGSGKKNWDVRVSGFLDRRLQSRRDSVFTDSCKIKFVYTPPLFSPRKSLTFRIIKRKKKKCEHSRGLSLRFRVSKDLESIYQRPTIGCNVAFVDGIKVVIEKPETLFWNMGFLGFIGQKLLMGTLWVPWKIIGNTV